MEALIRIANIPIVETGVKTAGNVYFNLKVTIILLLFYTLRWPSYAFIHSLSWNRIEQKRNGLLNWSFETAEGVLFAAVDSVRPAVKIIEGPLHRIDQILCSSLDVVEQRVPSVYLPPQLVSLSLFH